jgi:hypothetical protein
MGGAAGRLRQCTNAMNVHELCILRAAVLSLSPDRSHSRACTLLHSDLRHGIRDHAASL